MTRTELHHIEDLAGNLGALADKNLVSPEETAVLKNASSILWELQMKNEHICTTAEDWILSARKNFDDAFRDVHIYLASCFEEEDEKIRERKFDAARLSIQSVTGDLHLAEETEKGSTKDCGRLRESTANLHARLIAGRLRTRTEHSRA